MNRLQDRIRHLVCLLEESSTPKVVLAEGVEGATKLPGIHGTCPGKLDQAELIKEGGWPHWLLAVCGVLAAKVSCCLSRVFISISIAFLLAFGTPGISTLNLNCFHGLNVSPAANVEADRESDSNSECCSCAGANLGANSRYGLVGDDALLYEERLPSVGGGRCMLSALACWMVHWFGSAAVPEVLELLCTCLSLASRFFPFPVALASLLALAVCSSVETLATDAARDAFLPAPPFLRFFAGGGFEIGRAHV